MTYDNVETSNKKYTRVKMQKVVNPSPKSVVTFRVQAVGFSVGGHQIAHYCVAVS